MRPARELYPDFTTAQAVAFNDSPAVQSAAIAGVLPFTVVRVVATVNCYVLPGANPTVTSSNGMYLPAHTPILLRVAPSDKLSVLAAAAESGALSIVGMVE